MSLSCKKNWRNLLMHGVLEQQVPQQNTSISQISFVAANTGVETATSPSLFLFQQQCTAGITQGLQWRQWKRLHNCTLNQDVEQIWLKNDPAQSASFSTNHFSSLVHFMARWKFWLSVGQSRNELLQGGEVTVEAWHYYQKALADLFTNIYFRQIKRFNCK